MPAITPAEAFRDAAELEHMYAHRPELRPVNGIAPERNPKDIAGSCKPPLHLVPPVANILESLVLSYGATSHEQGPRGEYNWRTGPKISHRQYIAAALRHLAAIVDGEDDDPRSGISHWAHVRATAGIILDADSVGQVNDDRASPGAAAELIAKYTKPLPTQGDEVE